LIARLSLRAKATPGNNPLALFYRRFRGPLESAGGTFKTDRQNIPNRKLFGFALISIQRVKQESPIPSGFLRQFV
jgi:hypothetical protein